MDNFLYTYIDKDTYSSVKKFGLLSLYGLYSIGLMDRFIKSAEKYLDRGRMKKYNLTTRDIKKDPNNFFELFDKENGYRASKVIWFLFKEVTPNLHNERDRFLKQTILTKVPIEVFDNSYTYYGLGFSSVREWTPLTLKQVLNIKQGINQKMYEKKKGGKFLFTNIPHLAIAPPTGRIPSGKIIIGEK